ncbi:hypothetical protein NAF17_16520 [Mucilaginibacter sp. RB4R14]|uniref:response regulator n=1 Tax=Mucilaginibacter aurantiaciroseus TaxID=2949308 RepID=UPI002090D5B9|nr:response regulator [Mucilaginibacter aurantiaciroseus]MCO5937151.1 hypothetical protein [Mucilaginibacter aurantiaciroseus]
MGKYYNALEAMNFLKKQTVDFIFPDINMPYLTGMELAGLLPKETKIVFTTAYIPSIPQIVTLSKLSTNCKTYYIKTFPVCHPKN